MLHRLASFSAVSHMGRDHQLVGVWLESPTSVKIKTAKLSSEESARFSAKIFTSENFPLYGTMHGFMCGFDNLIIAHTVHTLH